MKTVQTAMTKPSISSGTAKPTLNGNTKNITGKTKIANNAAIPHATLRFLTVLIFVPKPINKKPAGASTK
jgi:hypothetical protein